ncbi:MAG TPA: S41 family peptidase [Candidatus Paceibacterota bacterium]|nr:S41 family peptidase [Candidatus Paceibacterota bacterium]
MKYKKFGLALVSVLVVGGFFYSGYLLGMTRVSSAMQVADASGAAGTDADFSAFWKVWNIINEKSIYNKNVDPQQKVWGAIEGLTASLGDPYTTFFPPEESKNFQSVVQGKFGGLGVEIGVRDQKLVVIAPLAGTPAAQAGIKSGDTITEVNGKPTSQMTVDEAVDQIRGEVGTSVTLTVVRDGEKNPLSFTIKRAVINIPTIDTKELPGGIFDIALYSFTSDSPDLFRTALRKFEQTGDHKLILDLRGNPGGYLEAAVDMASWFLPAGQVVVEEQSGGKVQKVYRSKGYNIFGNNLKLVILVDGGTASAAEILSGALSEHHVATLVGSQTFGKGSVQELVPITSDTSLKITVAEWLTPNGISISKNGLTPDVVVNASSTDFANGKDPQLSKAIQILNQ